MPLVDTHYQHWDGIHCGLWTRRWVIASNGLTACLRNKFLRNVVVATWSLSLAMVGALFVIGQLLVPDSLLVRWVSTLNTDLQGFANYLMNWLKDHPEISVRTTQDVLFYYFAILLMPFSIFAVGMAIPFLVTRDLASNAIIIYSSKAITRGDYLLGKFASVFGLLSLLWFGPVCAAWFFGNLLAPDWRFFWHARIPLFHVAVFGIVAMTTLSILALGVSSVSQKDKSTVAFWLVWWLLGFPLANIAAHTRPWLAHLSFAYDINQIALATFGLGKDLRIAQDNIPILGMMLRNIPQRTMDSFNNPPLFGSLVALALMLGAAGLVIHKRVRP